MLKIFTKKNILTIFYTISFLANASITLAATSAIQYDPMTGLWPLIDLIRSFAKPIGIGIATWGLYEYVLDIPTGKRRVKAAIFMFIGIWLLPMIFESIETSFKSSQPINRP